MKGVANIGFPDCIPRRRCRRQWHNVATPQKQCPVKKCLKQVQWLPTMAAKQQVASDQFIILTTPDLPETLDNRTQDASAFVRSKSVEAASCVIGMPPPMRLRTLALELGWLAPPKVFQGMQVIY